MANTSYYKTHVEPFVREELERRHGLVFTSRTLTLTTGGTHEFDAVSSDGSVVASIKSLSGKTSGGKRPAAKYSTCLAELYFLSLVKAPRRVLVLTTPDWYAMFMRYMENRLDPRLKIELIRLPDDIQAEVDRVRALASGEVSGAAAAEEEVGDEAGSTGDTVVGEGAMEETSDRVGIGCREEVLAAAAHLHYLGQSDFTPDEIIRALHARDSRYADSTIRTHVVSRLCGDAPDNHETTYDDLQRVAPGRYRLRGSFEVA